MVIKNYIQETSDNVFIWNCRGCGQPLRCKVLQRGPISIQCPECNKENSVPESRTAPVYKEWQISLKEQEQILKNEGKARTRELKSKLKEQKREERKAAKNEPEVITNQDRKKIQRNKKKKAKRRAGLFQWLIVWIVISGLSTIGLFDMVMSPSHSQAKINQMNIQQMRGTNRSRRKGSLMIEGAPYTVEMFRSQRIGNMWFLILSGFVVGLFFTFLFRIFIGVIRMLV